MVALVVASGCVCGGLPTPAGGRAEGRGKQGVLLLPDLAASCVRYAKKRRG
jgi:hypothetical protein